MSDEKTITPTEERENKFFARGRTHGVIQVIVFWVFAIVIDLLSMKLRYIRFFNPILYYTIIVSNILTIPIYLICEKKLCEGTRDGNYLGGYICGSLITFIFTTVFICTPLADLIFFTYPYYEPGDGRLMVASYLVYFLPSNIIAFILTLIVRAVIKHIETKKRNQNEHRTAV